MAPKMKKVTTTKAVVNTVKKSHEFQYPRIKTDKFKFGAHVGMAGGISKAVINAMNIGANSFALFLKSPRKWVSPEISEEEVKKFADLCKIHGYNPLKDILPHGSYFINLANPDTEKEQKAYDSFLDDLKRCEKLGIGLYNFHPGSSLDGDHKEALERLARNINRAIEATSFVKIVIENMAGHGNLIGSKLQDIKDVIEMVNEKTRVGVCIDTCHTYAAGYDISTKEKFDNFWNQFEDTIGWEYLSAIHLNDSKAPLGANRDLHQNLGQGFLGLEPFRLIANMEKLQGIPIILETPAADDDSIYGEEIKLLEWLEGKLVDDKEFVAKLVALQKLGQLDRANHLKKFQEKQVKLEKTSKKQKKDIKVTTTKKRKIQTTL